MTTASVTPAGGAAAPGPTRDAPGSPAAASGGARLGAVPALRVAAVLAAGVTLVVVLGLVDLTLGTSGTGAGDLLGLLTGGAGGEAEQTAAVLVASRLPRVLSALLVGVALGVSGAMLQSVARNPLASPDTLAVNAGSYLLVTVAAVTGLTLPFAATGAVAFVGGLGAAALVLLLSRGGASGPTRLVLAGSAVMLALSAVTSLLLLLFEQETIGLFAWGSGSIVQSGPEKVVQAAPAVLFVAAFAVARARRLDLLALGDDTATVLGLDVRRTRVEAVLVAVLLAAIAVTVAGPIGFVGLCAPAIARLVAPLAPELHRHRLLLPLAALAGSVVVLAADILLRTFLPGTNGVVVPTGVVTSVFGAVVLVALARRVRDSSPVSAPSTSRGRGPASRRRFLVVTAVLGALVVATVVGGLLLGDTLLLTGDVAHWLSGRSGPGVTAVLDQRAPRVLASLVAGAALGLAGTTVQAVCRNPLAEPGLLGVTGGAGVGAVLLLVLVPGVSIWAVTGAGALGALAAFALVYGLAYRRGLSSDRLVLIGVGVSAGTTALVTIIVVTSSPWDSTLALTWMSGSTYGRSFAQSLPVLGMLLLVTPFVARARRDLDLLALDEDVPRVLGVPLERTRLGLLLASVLLAGSAVSAIGVVGFVGLVAPHAARALVGARHTRVVPVALLLGAVLVGVSDVLGRTIIAPAQIPAGLVTALVGTPYFVLLLWRTRA